MHEKVVVYSRWSFLTVFAQSRDNCMYCYKRIVKSVVITVLLVNVKIPGVLLKSKLSQYQYFCYCNRTTGMKV